MKFEYDKAADVLYITLKSARHVVCLDGPENILTRVDPVSRTVVGFTLMDFWENLTTLKDAALPYVKEKAAEQKLLELVQTSARELRHKGRKSFSYNLHFSFTRDMAQEIAV